ncbi:MAG: hypothetical protein GX372_01505 [Ignavibacteria bacterium]|jgi:hypothetical protein|nr:hypothetical protein [Ignavibacteria bacterium]
MYKHNFYLILSLILLAILFSSCETEIAEDPNTLGGNWNLPQNEVGAEYGIYQKIGDFKDGKFEPKAFVTKNEEGIVTIHLKVNFDKKAKLILDTLLGLETIDVDVKNAWIDAMKKKYNFKLDTSDSQNSFFEYDIKTKITDQGIQGFLHDPIKPFTLIKYNCKVGDKYEFVNSQGEKFVRTVVYKDEDKESYDLVWWKIKVTKVEEIVNEPFIEKITYFANHKFGLVNVEFTTKTGKTASVGIVPWKAMPE